MHYQMTTQPFLLEKEKQLVTHNFYVIFSIIFPRFLLQFDQLCVLILKIMSYVYCRIVMHSCLWPDTIYFYTGIHVFYTFLWKQKYILKKTQDQHATASHSFLYFFSWRVFVLSFRKCEIAPNKQQDKHKKSTLQVFFLVSFLVYGRWSLFYVLYVPDTF